MILDKVKLQIKNMLGESHKFIFHGSRNQNEEFYGKVVKMYPSIFLIELDDGQKKSYCYNDVLIFVLEIVE